MCYSIFIPILIIVIVIIYLYKSNEHFSHIEKDKKDKRDEIQGIDPISQYEPTNYSTKKQNCNELTYSPENCNVETVIPSRELICNKSLNPLSNNIIINQKEMNPSHDLGYDFDLLSSFNDAQLNNLPIDQVENFSLFSDAKSLNSLDGDLISNF